MINFDDVMKENIKDNTNQPKIPDHPYRILNRGSGSENKKFIIQSNKPATRQ